MSPSSRLEIGAEVERHLTAGNWVSAQAEVQRLWCADCNSAAASYIIASYDRHPEVLLRPERFASIQINWNPKAESLRFLPTAKNRVAESFFVNHGFELMERTEVGSLWSLDLQTAALKCPAWIELNCQRAIPAGACARA